MQTSRDQGEPVGGACFDPNASNPEDRDGEMGMTGKAHIPPSSKLNNPSPTDLPARKKHDAVLP